MFRKFISVQTDNIKVDEPYTHVDNTASPVRPDRVYTARAGSVRVQPNTSRTSPGVNPIRSVLNAIRELLHDKATIRHSTVVLHGQTYSLLTYVNLRQALLQEMSRGFRNLSAEQISNMKEQYVTIQELKAAFESKMDLARYADNQLMRFYIGDIDDQIVDLIGNKFASYDIFTGQIKPIIAQLDSLDLAQFHNSAEAEAYVLDRLTQARSFYEHIRQLRGKSLELSNGLKEYYAHDYQRIRSQIDDEASAVLGELDDEHADEFGEIIDSEVQAVDGFMDSMEDSLDTTRMVNADMKKALAGLEQNFILLTTRSISIDTRVEAVVEMAQIAQLLQAAMAKKLACCRNPKAPEGQLQLLNDLVNLLVRIKQLKLQETMLEAERIKAAMANNLDRVKHDQELMQNIRVQESVSSIEHAIDDFAQLLQTMEELLPVRSAAKSWPVKPGYQHGKAQSTPLQAMSSLVSTTLKDIRQVSARARLAQEKDAKDRKVDDSNRAIFSRWMEQTSTESVQH